MTISEPTKQWIKYIFFNPRMAFFYRFWRDSLKPGRSPLVDQYPWIVFRAVLWLNNYLKPQMTVFEWGSGGSTLFLAKRVQSVISVEHDAKWFLEVHNNIAECEFDNITYKLVEPVKSDQTDDFYASSDGRYCGESFIDYASSIDEYGESFFDLVIVDGRARTGCIKHAVRMIKPGGYLLLDNSEREGYSAGKLLLKGWRKAIFKGPGPYIDYFFETTVWQRPTA